MRVTTFIKEFDDNDDDDDDDDDELLTLISGVREHNQYSHSLPFPLVNSDSHSRVLTFLFPFSFKFCYVPFPPERLPKP